jgi:hypothetical protein
MFALTFPSRPRAKRGVFSSPRERASRPQFFGEEGTVYIGIPTLIVIILLILLLT